MHHCKQHNFLLFFDSVGLNIFQNLTALAGGQSTTKASKMQLHPDTPALPLFWTFECKLSKQIEPCMRSLLTGWLVWKPGKLQSCGVQPFLDEPCSLLCSMGHSSYGTELVETTQSEKWNMIKFFFLLLHIIWQFRCLNGD